MINILSVLGYGDSIITAMILELCGYDSINKNLDVRVIGNNNTAVVWNILGLQPHANIIAFDDIPAFYDLKNSNLVGIVRDFYQFRRILNTLRDGDILFFEKPSEIRSNLLLKGSSLLPVFVPQKNNAYLDRAKVLGDLFSKKITFPEAHKPKCPAKSVLINPSARQKSRVLDFNTINILIEISCSLGVEVTLLDFYGNLSSFESKVAHYEYRPVLEKSIELLKNSDRYIGPDSFFVHLAYFFKVPQLAFFKSSWIYFCPPGLLDQDGVYYFEDINKHDLLKSKLIKLLT